MYVMALPTAVGVVVILYIFLWLLYQLYTPKKNYVSDLKDKCILVTGCDSGFGHMLVKQLDQLQCRVIATCFTAAGRDGLREQCSLNVTTLLMDVTNGDSVAKAYDEVCKVVPQDTGLWGIVNNAGNVNVVLPLEVEPMADMARIMDVNLWGAIRVTQTFLPLLKKSKGRIINVISCLANQALPMTSAYCMSKSALKAFTACSRMEMRKFGISVHGIEPGFFKTRLTNPEFMQEKFEASWEKIPADMKDEYEELPNAFTNSMKVMDLLTSSNVSMVTDAMVHALLSLWPKASYVIGYDHLFFFSWFHRLPSCIMDPLVAFLLMRYSPKSTKSS